MSCSRVYEGDVTKLNKETAYSHGVCDRVECKIKYVRFSFGCDRAGAIQIIGGLERVLKNDIL